MFRNINEDNPDGRIELVRSSTLIDNDEDEENYGGEFVAGEFDSSFSSDLSVIESASEFNLVFDDEDNSKKSFRADNLKLFKKREIEDDLNESIKKVDLGSDPVLQDMTFKLAIKDKEGFFTLHQDRQTSVNMTCSDCGIALGYDSGVNNNAGYGGILIVTHRPDCKIFTRHRYENHYDAVHDRQVLEINIQEDGPLGYEGYGG